MTKRNIVLGLLSAGLFIVAGFAWLSYVGHGIAYGDLMGVSGSDKLLAEIGKGAVEALSAAACLEALAVGLLCWLFSDPLTPVWGRVAKGVAFGLLADVLTYVLVRGL